MQLHFLGANRQVTGSRTVFRHGGKTIMVDCGLFQERAVLERNWAAPVVPPAELDALILTHAHLDHTGLVPRLVKNGFNGPIYATPPTVDLARIIMEDSAKIQQEDASYKRKRHKRAKRRSKHPVEPLYSIDDAEAAGRMLKPVAYGDTLRIGDMEVRFHEAGHILGSAMVELKAGSGDATRRIIFSGDIGQWDKPLIGDPTLLERADYVICESTYGDRSHKDEGSIGDRLEAIVNRTVRRGGKVLIPTFALERAQELLYHMSRLVHDDLIPDIPVYLDSPMAIDVTDVFRRYKHLMDDETKDLLAAGQPPMRFPGLRMSRTGQDSKGINRQTHPSVIMATSGMCTAGRIKHHLRLNIEKAEATVLFVGYQSPGTLGREILNGAERVRIHGNQYDVRAEITQLHGLSAHADREDLIRWVKAFGPPPRRVFFNHGDTKAAKHLAERVRSETGAETHVPEYGEIVELH